MLAISREFGKAGGCDCGGSLQAPSPSMPQPALQTPVVNFTVHGIPSPPPRCSPGTRSVLLPLSTGLKKPGLPSSTGNPPDSSGPGRSWVSPGWPCSPPAAAQPS